MHGIGLRSVKATVEKQTWTVDIRAQWYGFFCKNNDVPLNFDKSTTILYISRKMWKFCVNIYLLKERWRKYKSVKERDNRNFER